MTRVVMGTFQAVGADVRAGAMLPQLFAQAGVGIPDGTDVTGRVESLEAGGRAHAENACRSLLPATPAHGITTEAGSAAMLAELASDAWPVRRQAGALAPHGRRMEA